MPPLAYANYAMGSPQVGFFFRVELPTFCILCLVSVLVSAFYFLDAELDAVFTYGGSTIRVCTFATLWSLPMAGNMCNLVMVIGPHLVCIEQLLP